MADSGRRREYLLWHNAFYQRMFECSSPAHDVHVEVPLSQQPSRVDLVLRRRAGEPRHQGEASILRGLWPRLAQVTLVEFKSPRRPLRLFELSSLLGHGIEFHALNPSLNDDDLNLVLLTPCMNAALRRDIQRFKGRLEPLGDGYARLVGNFPYTTYVAFLNEVAEAERDEYLRLFTTNPGPRDPAALHWLHQCQWKIGQTKIMPDIVHMKEYDEMITELLSSVTVEQRLAGLSPEERLVGLSPEELEALATLLARRDPH